MTTSAFLNRIACSIPAYDVHPSFLQYFESNLVEQRPRSLFRKLAAKAQIRSRWSCLAPTPAPHSDRIDVEGFYIRGRFPTTGARMNKYEMEAPGLAAEAVDRLELSSDGDISHLILTSCTGFYAPGLDVDILARCKLDMAAERTLVGFMGCNAALNALKLARHIVRSDPRARVLIVSLELCTLHLQETASLEKLLGFLQFGDGCAAALVSADPRGFELLDFDSLLFPEGKAEISWRIQDLGFDMVLSVKTPGCIGAALRGASSRIFATVPQSEIQMWAVHPGGRSILDAVETALNLNPTELAVSRSVLESYGNMSSPTVLFVLEAFLRQNRSPGSIGCAMAFGPGLTAETLMFRQSEAAQTWY
jgi:alpha-pyrone synthase